MADSIFKAYDVRGKYPAELNEETVEKIAAALAKHFRKGDIVVGRDGRLSSPALYEAALRGFKVTSSKIQVVQVGVITTPMLYFLVNHLQAAGGVMVTASHNPKEYNGIKAVGPKAKPINGSEIRQLVDGMR